MKIKDIKNEAGAPIPEAWLLMEGPSGTTYKIKVSNFALEGKFRGIWAPGALTADCYYIFVGKLWRTKSAFNSSSGPTVANAYWELVKLDGQEISFSQIIGTWDQNASIAGKFQSVNEFIGTEIKKVDDKVNNKVDQVQGSRLITAAEVAALNTYRYSITFPLISEVTGLNYLHRAGTLKRVYWPQIAINAVSYRKNGGGWVNVPNGTDINIGHAAGDLFDWKITYKAGYNSGSITVTGQYS
ncbi:hypothetical protein EFA69_16110 [Rufibacter immobilis]|uniref:Uncharacterized protein n=1 Tax=Rufibacter immobilis TaxID=1348778 RepID=A0A3M9MQ76_9BACT|nr:hypothetical protein [Rufibacter immobilis]RNI27641.1 hypothetical protein EFA69_16110 [Rufibacter immobilis]